MPIPIAYDKSAHNKSSKEKLPIKLPEKLILIQRNPLDHQKKWKEISINGEICTLYYIRYF